MKSKLTTFIYNQNIIRVEISDITMYTTHVNQCTVRAALKFWKFRFLSLNIPDAEVSIKNIMSHVLGLKCWSDVDRTHSRILSNEERNNFENFCRMRLARVPIQYIIGEWQFRAISLKMKPPVFIPRPETECLVDIVIKHLQTTKEGCRILDVGCGSGAISLSLLEECPKITCVAIDQNPTACELTLENAKNLKSSSRIQVLCASVTSLGILSDNVLGKFDVIVSNPPYIPEALINHLEPEVKKYEDYSALCGGHTGLKVVKDILHMAKEKLFPNGHLFLEVDLSHPHLLCKMFRQGYYKPLCLKAVHKDFTSRNRFLEIMKY